jgi:hypothetical protein
MKIELLDKSKYLKGLLVLSRKDNMLSDWERRILRNAGRSLGFEERFLESSINDLLVNEYLTEEPPVFSNKYIAESFLKNGLLLAGGDRHIDKRELQFLWETAKANNISEEEFHSILESFVEQAKIEIPLDEFFKSEMVT